MEFSLFLDTSLNITIGLLDKNNSWIDYIHLADKKSASKIHNMLYETLEKHELKLENIANLYYCSGPGSYTGMRVTEGIARVFTWQGVNTRSFYHYMIPRFCGLEDGVWLANAYKGEYFLYSWDKGNEDKVELLPIDAVNLDNLNFYSHDPEIVEKTQNNTVKMIFENSKIVFTELQKLSDALPLNYYRLPENEFKLKKKKNE